jgi:hypothetical protein
MNKSMWALRLTAVAFSTCASLMLSGCYESLHTRWAGAGDSAARWSAMMPALPVDLHSQDSSVTPLTALSNIPNATTADSYARSHPDAQPLNRQPRLVLYIGGNQLPTAASYCEAVPALQSSSGTPDGVLIGGAICDGSRLVDTVQRTYAADRLASEGPAHAVDDIKSQLLFGLSVRQSKPPVDSDAN